jgi:hypothetical protein
MYKDGNGDIENLILSEYYIRFATHARMRMAKKGKVEIYLVKFVFQM